MKRSIAFALASLVGAGPVWAAPPGHAPAHGYYKTNKPYTGKSGAVYVSDYGIASGHCNRDEIGAVIGGVTGAVIGGQVASPGNRAVGMVVGGVFGAAVGYAIGDSMDDGDRACMGHALELGRAGVPVEWSHDGSRYQFTPRGDARDGCRNATMVVDGRKPQDVLACPSGKGEWSFSRR